MERVFITGATGFVGGGVLGALTDGSREVRALARTRTAGETVAAAGAEPLIGHLLEPDVLATGMEGCDGVFHVAGVNQMCVADPTEMFRVNVEGTRAVVAAAAAAGVRRIVLTSSAAVMGAPNGGAADEASPHDGVFLSAYARSKYEAEQAFFAATADAGIEGIAVNPSSVQGPGRATGSARLLLYGLRRRFPIVVPAAVSIVDIADSSLGHLLAWRRGVPGERYILSGSTIDIADAVRLLGEVAGIRRTPIVLPRWLASVLGRPAAAIAARMSDSGFFCRETLDTLLAGSRYDGSKATRELGLEYTPLEATLERTVRWLHDYGFIGRRLRRFGG